MLIMFIQLLITSSFLLIIVQSQVANSSIGQSPTPFIFPKQAALDDAYDLTDQTSTGEGSGGAASLDEYADEEEDQLLKLSKSTMTSSTTISTTIRTTTKKIPVQNESVIKHDDFNGNEFNDDYKDDLEHVVDYDDTTPTTTTSQSTIIFSTSSIPGEQRQTSIREFFSLVARPKIAIGILVGLSIGILTSVILLICIIRRFRKRERTHSSYTTGLLYPNQYGYSKSPQEFYA